MRKPVIAGNWKMSEKLEKAVFTPGSHFFTIIFSAVLTLQGLVAVTDAQHKKIPKEPVQIVDASNGKVISEALIIPKYYSANGIYIASPEPSGMVPRVRQYLKYPFVYKTGEQFLVKKPMFFKGLPLLLVFVGQFKDIEGIMVLAKGYRPLWTDDLWGSSLDNQPRKLTLTPISDEEWAKLLKNELNPLVKGDEKITSGCKIWDYEADCELNVDFKKKERELIRSFLLQTKIETK